MREGGGGRESERARGRESERGRGRERERETERACLRESSETELIAKPTGRNYINICKVLNISKEKFNGYKVCNKSIYKRLCNSCILILRFNFYIF
jgi:hypothetical protein